jgi:hypothetical protein
MPNTRTTREDHALLKILQARDWDRESVAVTVRTTQRTVVAGDPQRDQFAAQVLGVERFHLDQQSHHPNRFEWVRVEQLEGAGVQGADQGLIAALIITFKTDPLELRGPPELRITGAQERFSIGFDFAKFVPGGGRDDHVRVELSPNLMHLEHFLYRHGQRIKAQQILHLRRSLMQFYLQVFNRQEDISARHLLEFPGVNLAFEMRGQVCNTV